MTEGAGVNRHVIKAGYYQTKPAHRKAGARQKNSMLSWKPLPYPKRNWPNIVAVVACMLSKYVGGAAVVNKPMTSVPKHPHSKQKSLKQNVNASRNWSANCVVKMPPWLKRRPSWPCEKKSRRSGGTRKNDQRHRSPPNC